VTTLANIATHTAQVARTIPGRRARHVATLADLLANRLPDTSRVIAATLAAHDGYPCSASGADAGPRPRGGISRPTERHALARHGDPWPGGHSGPSHDAATVVDLVTHALRWVLDAARFHAEAPERPPEPRTGRSGAPGAGESRIATGRTDVDARLDQALTAIREAHTICDRHQPPTDPRHTSNLRCRGTGDATGATCEQMADYRIGNNGIALNTGDGRCIDCRQTVARRKDAERKRKQKRGVA